MSMLQRKIREHVHMLRTKELLPAVGVFLVLLITAKLGQYLLDSEQISPAVVWAPSGIALAAMLLRGYHMWIPITAAAFLGSITSTAEVHVLVFLAAVLGQALQPVIATYLLRRWNFVPTFESMRHVLVFTLVTLIVCAVIPTLSAGTRYLTETLVDGFYQTWTRIWAAHMFSILVLTPLLLTWILRRPTFTRRGFFDALLAFSALSASLYLLFWTTLAQSFSFLFLLAMFIVFFWIALRLNFRAMTLAVFLMAAIGMAGPLLSGVETAQPINQRLFTIELFVILFAPMFFMFSALVKERRVAFAMSTSRARDLEAALRRLEESDRQKDEFISTLAHELRNPLGALLNSLELIQLQGVRASDTDESLAIAVRQTGQIDKMLRNLLDSSRATQGKIELALEEVEAADLLRNALETIQPILKDGGQILKAELPQKKLHVQCDPLRVEQILVNLLSNAIKYTDRNGRIAVSAERDGTMVVFRVSDTGKGVAPEMIDKIFDIFVQDRRALSIQGGLGIGLTLSRKLAELHGGSVTATSAGLGLGSQFTLRLPLTQPAAIQKP